MVKLFQVDLDAHFQKPLYAQQIQSEKPYGKIMHNGMTSHLKQHYIDLGAMRVAIFSFVLDSLILCATL